MTHIRIQLLGTFRIWYHSQLVENLTSQRAQELLSYILLYRDRPHHREMLAGKLWGDYSTQQTQKWLRQALWQIHTALNAITNTPLLVSNHDSILLNPDADIHLDVANLENTLKDIQQEKGAHFDSTTVQALQTVVDCYEGDLLEGWYHDWCIYERERLQHIYLIILDKLIEYCLRHQNYAQGIDYGNRILQYDSARENTHRYLMSLHYLSGHRVTALRQYQRCVQSLKEEFGVEPAPETVALYKQIQTASLTDLQVPLFLKGDPYSQATANTVTFAVMLSHFEYLEKTLVDMQQQVYNATQIVKRVLKDPEDTSNMSMPLRASSQNNYRIN